MNCPPLNMINELSQKYPGCWEQVEMFRRLKYQGELDWEEHCYIPISATLAIVSPNGDTKDLLADPEIIRDAAKIAAAAPWRMYKQIYSFPEEMETLLYEQAEDCVLPLEVLYNLPFPCIYIETKCVDGIDGFFVHFESDDSGRIELRLLFLLDNMIAFPLAIHIGENMTIEDGINAMFKEALRVAALQGEIIERRAKEAEKSEYELEHGLAKIFMQLILYICAQNKEIKEDTLQKSITRIPKNPKFIKDKFREVQKWVCGESTAKIIRGVFGPQQNVHYNYATYSEKSTHRKRPHARRGHWHHYWTGTKDERKAILKWQPPTIVHAEEFTDTTVKINKIDKHIE